MNIKFYFLFFFIANISSAQVPNGNFENWNGTEPDSWQTTNIPIVPQSIIEDTEAFSGNSAVKGIVVSQQNGLPFQPYLGIYGPLAQGFSISQPYDYVEGWIKVNVNPGDKLVGIVHIYNNNQETISEGRLVIDSTISQWTPFSIPMIYDSIPTSNLTCSMFFTITDASEISSGLIGSYFVLDQLSMSRGSIGIEQVSKNETFSVYPNPVVDEMNIKSNTDEESKYVLNDLAGQKILEGKIYKGFERIFVQNLSRGIYILNVNYSSGIVSRKIVIQ